ncbi:MAG: hypothetical protein PHU70_02010 [Dehalococcoidia bacterium]|nr:hypothetical protein [Dehalococcoidia bacterium]
MAQRNPNSAWYWGLGAVAVLVGGFFLIKHKFIDHAPDAFTATRQQLDDANVALTPEAYQQWIDDAYARVESGLQPGEMVYWSAERGYYAGPIEGGGYVGY